MDAPAGRLPASNDGHLAPGPPFWPSMYRSQAPSLPHSSSYRSPSPLPPAHDGGTGQSNDDDGLLAQLDAVAPLRSFDGPSPRPQRPEPSRPSACLQGTDGAARTNVLRSSAFPKVQSTYTSKSTRGGFITAAVCWTIFLLVLNDLGEYLYGDLRETFHVDRTVAKEMQLNVDLVRPRLAESLPPVGSGQLTSAPAASSAFLRSPDGRDALSL
jgi:hypothetical protein